MRLTLHRLGSRKFLFAVAVLVLEALGVQLRTEVIAIVGAWIVGESVVDAAAAKRPNIVSTPTVVVPSSLE